MLAMRFRIPYVGCDSSLLQLAIRAAPEVHSQILTSLLQGIIHVYSIVKTPALNHLYHDLPRTLPWKLPRHRRCLCRLHFRQTFGWGGMHVWADAGAEGGFSLNDTWVWLDANITADNVIVDDEEED